MVQQNYFQICIQKNFRFLSKIVLSTYIILIYTSKFSDIIKCKIPSFSQPILIIATFICKIVAPLDRRRNQAISSRVLPLNDGASWSC